MLIKLQEAETISEQGFQSFRRQWEYHNISCKATRWRVNVTAVIVRLQGVRYYQNSAFNVAGERGNIRTVFVMLLDGDGIPEQCLQRYRRQREYHKSVCKGTDGRGNIVTSLANVQEREGLPELCLKFTRDRGNIRIVLVKLQ